MITLLLLCTVVLLAFLSWISLIWDSNKLSIPGPFPLPVIGNANLFFKKSANFINVSELLTKKYGSISRFYMLSKRCLLISNPKYIEAIIKNTELITKGHFTKMLQPWLGSGLITATGNRWKAHRKFLTPAFHFNILQNFLPVFLKNKNILISKLKPLADGKPFEMGPFLALYALDNVTESIMGVSCHAQMDNESEYVKSIAQLGAIIYFRSQNPFAEIDGIFNILPSKKIQDKALEVVHGQANKVIEARREELLRSNITKLNVDSEHGIKSKYAFLDLLLLAEMDGQKFDFESIREEVDTFMFAGHDTTTSGMTFCFFILSKYPEEQEKLLEEQRSILGDDLDRDPTYNELQQMKYLDLVIKESFRLYPPVPMIDREIKKEVELADIFIPKDTTILIDIINMHRNAEFFKDPLEFRPERFENSQHNPFSWLAFSAGARNCIGQKFALLEVKATISAIVRNFIILPSGKEPILTGDIVLKSENGVYISLKPRKY